MDLDAEVIHISEQLVSISYEVHEDDPKAVQAMLGHSSMRMTTDTYQTVLPEMHAATASASLDLINAYRKAEQAAAKLGHAALETTDGYQVQSARPERAAAKKAMKRQRRRVA